VLTKAGRIICDFCGRFISYADLMDDRAAHHLETPDSEFTKEEYESYHYACAALDKQETSGWQPNHNGLVRTRLNS
jgi:hypothetical protein